MKTNALYLLTPDGRYGVSLYPKMILLSIIIALMFASFPAASVLAAPASAGSTTVSNDLAKAWQNKLDTLRYHGLFYDTIRLYPADFDQPSDLARAHFYLEKYGFALRAANTIAFNHAGFDIKGHVLNERLADETVRDLAMYLQTMRGLRDKMEEIPSQSRFL
jgi:hypothetical protein